MRSIGNYTYAALLSLSIFAIQPALANAQEAHGRFTLPREVHWQNRVFSPGEYDFSTKHAGGSQMLIMRNLSGTGPGAIMLVEDTQPSQPTDISRLILVERNGQTFVSAMTLPAFDLVLRFTVPSEIAEKHPTLASAAGATSSAR